MDRCRQNVRQFIESPLLIVSGTVTLLKRLSLRPLLASRDPYRVFLKDVPMW